VEVRQTVVVEVHRDRDPEEAADRWHSAMVPLGPVGPDPLPRRSKSQEGESPLVRGAGSHEAADGTRTHDLLHGNRLRFPH
jgi:hypothetical protein